jgi:hypothetical protein
LSDALLLWSAVTMPYQYPRIHLVRATLGRWTPAAGVAYSGQSTQ